MGKYVYLSFVKWTDLAMDKGSNYFNKEWFPKHDELCRKHKVTMLQHGVPFGTVEEHVFVYETDLPLADYQLFRNDVAAISKERLVAWTNTTIVNCAR